MLGRKRVKRLRSGRFSIRLPEEERELLRRLPGQLRELLGTDDPSLKRLFPPAYLDDPEKDADYQRLMRDELLMRHEQSLTTMEETIDATELEEGQLHAWMAALNELRLVLGTRLDVTENEDFGADLDPSNELAPAYALYGYLGWLQDEVVTALAGW